MKRFLYLYVDGFRNMGILGKTLWVVILVKFFVMFFLFKFFFFEDYLGAKFDTDEERTEYVIENLIKTPE